MSTVEQTSKSRQWNDLATSMTEKIYISRFRSKQREKYAGLQRHGDLFIRHLLQFESCWYALQRLSRALLLITIRFKHGSLQTRIRLPHLFERLWRIDCKTSKAPSDRSLDKLSTRNSLTDDCIVWLRPGICAMMKQRSPTNQAQFYNWLPFALFSAGRMSH
jgi:hypothetical protein